MHPSDRTYRNQTVRIADLTVISDRIESATFENCTIEGPAVVVLQGGELRNSGFDGDLDALLWSIPDHVERVIGAVALVNCVIVGCNLRRIGLAVRASDVTGFREALSG